MFTEMPNIAVKVEVGENFWFSNLEHIDRIMRIIINLDKYSSIRLLFSYSSSWINVHLIFPLFPENRKSIPKFFSGKNL